MEPPPTALPQSALPVKRLALLAAFLLPFLFAIRGTDWSKNLHPDEISFHISMRSFARERKPVIGGSIYPEGFFVLADAYRRLCAVSRQAESFCSQEDASSRDPDRIRAPIPDRLGPSIAMGRHLNAVLAGLCGLFLFLAVRAAGGGAAAGLCASLLGAGSPFVVEHAHYCESDLSFCAALALSVWLLFGALRRRSAGWTIGAAAACAAAFACKYTVAPLVPFCIAAHLSIGLRPVFGAGADTAERRRILRRFAFVSILCLLAAVAAYVFLTPLIWVDPPVYWSKIFKIYGAAHAEAMDKDLAGEGNARLLLFRFVLRSLLLHLRTMGPAHLLLAGAGAAVLLWRRRRNPCGPWLLALVALFAAFDLAFAPWIRSQEFLPFAILLGLVPALAAAELGVLAAGSRRRAVRAGVPALCLLICAAAALPDSFRAARLFSSAETRYALRNWLEQSASPDRRFAANRFAYAALRSDRIRTADRFDEPERLWEPGSVDPADPGHDYFVRQSLLPGRGMTYGATGRLLPQYEAGWSNFLAHATLLREWRTTPGYQATFSQLPTELWAIVPPGARSAKPVPLSPRATSFRMGPEAYDAPQGGDWLGPIEAIRAVGARKQVRFVPPADGRPVYAVVRHVAGVRPAKIKWEGSFSPRSKDIDPGRADWFVCKPGPLAGLGDVCVRTRVRMRGDDQTSVCLATVTADPVYAAELLVRGGSPDKAAGLLALAGLPAGLPDAVAQGAPALPESVWRDFARIRFARFTVYPEGENEFPVAFDPGTYRVSFRLPDDPDASALHEIGLSGAAESRILSGGSFRPGERVELEIRFDRPVRPRLVGRFAAADESPRAVALLDFQVEWDPLPPSGEP